MGICTGKIRCGEDGERESTGEKTVIGVRTLVQLKLPRMYNSEIIQIKIGLQF